MGSLLSRLRRKKSTKDELEKIKVEIDNLENRRNNVARREKRFILILNAIAVLSVLVILAYWYYSKPVSWKLLSAYLCVIISIPYSVWVFNKSLRWYHSRKIRKDEQKLKDLKEKKSKVIKNVMETETFIVAKDILELHAPELLGRHKLNQTPQRPSVVEKKPQHTPASSAQSPDSTLRRRTFDQPTPSPVLKPEQVAEKSNISRQRNINGVSVPPGPPLPQPVLPQKRSYADRVMDYLIGDGPSNRYALICKKCDSHNGMALKEEFEYISFRCCYCFCWNPSRKERPTAPKLSQQQNSSEEDSEDDESSSTSETAPADQKAEGNKEKSEDSDKKVTNDGNISADVTEGVKNVEATPPAEESRTDPASDSCSGAEDPTSNKSHSTVESVAT